MDVMEMVSQARDAVTVRKVFGDPYERDGVTVIPAARVFGAGGGGSGESQDKHESGGGTGYSLSARPVGAFVIRNGEVTWVPSLDVTRVAIGGQLVAIATILAWRSVRRAKLRTKRSEARHG